MKKIIFLLACFLVVLLAPQKTEAFVYKGKSLGIYFEGERLFTKTVLNPHEKSCASLVVENFSNKNQKLGLATEGFKDDNFFRYVDLSVIKKDEEIFKKLTQLISPSTDEAEFLFAVAPQTKEDFKICLQINKDLPNELQGQVSQPVNFRFGFIGESFAPPVSLASTETLGSSSGRAEGVATQTKPSDNQKEEVKGESKSQCKEGSVFVRYWYCWLLLLMIITLLSWLVYKRTRKE
ncbi:hypothetical protein J7K05_01730 [bacterium]|nr:hypothetical protein [bacterium]